MHADARPSTLGAAARAAPTDARPVVGGRFAGYRLHRLLGQGAIGTVFLASTPSGRLVALKTVDLADSFGRDDQALAQQRFTAEAQAAMRLRHPNVVRVYAGGVTNGFGHLVMAPAPGCALDRYARPGRLLPEPLLLQLGAAIAGGLAHAHDHGVLHRDVKPSNVIVDIASRRLKITDFGLARLADPARTRTGLVLGTPAFMAPELLAGAPAHRGSDLYALGVLLFQLLTTQLPFDGRSMGELLRAIANGRPASLAALRPGTPPALTTLVHALIDADPANRPADASAVAQQLRALAAPAEAAHASGRFRAPATDPAAA